MDARLLPNERSALLPADRPRGSVGRPNKNRFILLAEARDIIGAWRADDNQLGAHNALGYKTPAEVAAAKSG